MTTLATPANMRRATLVDGKLRAYDPVSEEICECSVTAGDYFMLGDDEPLMTSDGCEPLQLVTVETRIVIRDALTGHAVGADDSSTDPLDAATGQGRR